MDSAELLLLLAAHFVLAALPLLAAALYAARMGVRQLPVLLAIGLAASGAVAMLAFWCYYADPLAGEAFSYLVLFGSILLVGWTLHGGGLDRALLRRLATPLLLWGLGSAFVLFLGFVHGGTEEPLIAATARFSHPLPGDNAIPLFYADWFFQHGHGGVPPVFPGEWLASDRPPLQVGYVLSQRAFGWDDAGLNYQVLGVVLQQLWIVGLWALLVAAGVGRLTRGLAMVAVLLSGLAVVNGFFVWPKMLPAAMLLGVAALAMTPVWEKLRRNLWAAGLIGLLCALAMLGHGSTVFGIVPLVVIAAYRGLPSWRWIGVAAAVGIALMAPWSAFQKYDSPPGNRLVKWTLAGSPEIDDRGTLETIVDAYGEAGFDGTVDNKIQNFVTMGGWRPTLDGMEAAVETGDLEQVVRAIRLISFFYLLPSMGLLLLAPIAMIAAWRRRGRNPAEWSFALACFAAFALGAIAWGLLFFGNEHARTVIHVSSYLLPLLGICGAVVGLRAAFPRFALYYAAAISLLSFAVYAPALDSPPGSAYEPLTAILAAFGLVGFVVAALRGDRTAGPSGATAVPASGGQAGAGEASARPEQVSNQPGQAVS